MTGVAHPHPVDAERRLVPEFVEWMMGFPIGWTAGQSRAQRLKQMGNAVVPAQGAAAFEILVRAATLEGAA